MNIDFKLFKDLTDALDRVGNWLNSAIQLPYNERKEYRDKLDETFTLIDTALVMVITRLSDILDPGHQGDFQSEVRKLGDSQEWLTAERSIRLCASLRATRREMETLKEKATGKISVKDWDALIHEIDEIIEGEDKLAKYISKNLKELSRTTYRGNVEMIRDALKKERNLLIQKEIELLHII